MKKPKILFTHSYFTPFDPKQLAWNKPYPPLMTIQAAAIMRAAGYPVLLFDVMFLDRADRIEKVLEEAQPEFLVIFDDGFNYLTKMCLTNMREAAWEMAALAKRRGAKVIACSSDATDHYEDYLAHGVDFVLTGEGEQSLLELINCLTTGQDYSMLLGIAYTKEGKVIKQPNRPVMQDLDTLPLPAWDLIDIGAYRQRWEQHWGYFSINIATTRGCPYKCNWCAKPIYGHSYKMRSPEHVIAEIKLIQRLFPFEHIWFCDDIFGLKRSWVMAFAELVKQEGLSFRYKIQSRADLLVKPQYIEALAASGCDEVWMGVESGSQRILDAMDKGISLSQIREANQLMRSYDIKPCFFIQFGYLDETAEDIKKTISLINELLPHDIGISVSYPLPGTLFFEKVKKDLFGKTNWTDSNDMDLMFENTYSPDFYKQLHHYVHQNYRMHLAKAQLKSLLKVPSSLRPATAKRALSYFPYRLKTYFSKQQLKAIDHEAANRI
ncbi:MAG: radical SAM protein [Saprospiraceae bacterium]